MPDPRPQSYDTHRHWPGHYFRFAAPLAFAAVVVSLWHLGRERSLGALAITLTAVAVQAALLSARLMANTVQDRVIRLEMRLRLREVLPAPLVPRIGELSRRQLVALRFASDAELPRLVERCLAGEFASSNAIKREIRDWQGDFLRA